MICVYPLAALFFLKASVPILFCASLQVWTLPLFISLTLWLPVTSFLLLMECLAELVLLFSFARGGSVCLPAVCGWQSLCQCYFSLVVFFSFL